jgi:hypothetical protein
MTQTEAPEYLVKDSYEGRHTTRVGKYRVSVFAASELAEMNEAGVLWISFGHVNGTERFSRNRYVAGPDGSLHLYASEGGKVIVHPADRKLRVLVS